MPYGVVFFGSWKPVFIKWKLNLSSPGERGGLWQSVGKKTLQCFSKKITAKSRGNPQPKVEPSDPSVSWVKDSILYVFCTQSLAGNSGGNLGMTLTRGWLCELSSWDHWTNDIRRSRSERHIFIVVITNLLRTQTVLCFFPKCLCRVTTKIFFNLIKIN